jgi:hypothetical protein
MDGSSSPSTKKGLVGCAGIIIRVDARIKLVGNVGVVGTSVGAGGMVSRSKANTARDSPIACMVTTVRVHAGISLVGDVG